MNFIKMQGAGNDFVMLRPADPNLDWPQIAKTLCDRRFGIGADGIILALPSTKADIKMRIFNSDGSEAETCGNGLRCLAKYCVLNSIIKPGQRLIKIETIPGVRTIKLGYGGNELNEIQVGMGIPRFAAAEIPVNIDSKRGSRFDSSPILDYPLSIDDRTFSLSFVSMGNPHAVHFIKEDVGDYPLSEYGPQVENHPIFPRRINFEIARVRNRQQIDARVWERGAGETLACGTGACAVAVAAHLHDYIGNAADIILPGGTLHIEWDGKGEVLMSGPAEVVYTGVWPD
jgi:diaminopimelate epimerase